MSNTEGASGAEGFAFPVGHLGHLSASQQESLREFKKLCQDRGKYTPAQGGGLPSHEDQTMLRFLRARKFQLEPAYKQFVDSQNWCRENKIGELYDTIDIHEYDETRKLYPQWVGSRDKRGMPVYLFEVAGLSSKVIAAHEKATELKAATDGIPASPKMAKLFALYENLTNFVTPWCSALSNRPYYPTPITQGCNIIDIKGTGIRQFWDLKNHLQDSSQLATAYYPETLDKIFIIGAPSFFPSVWSWVKRWFDPVVVSKMFIISNHEVLQVLSEHIDPQSIPAKYGGGLQYNFGDMPNLLPDVLEGWTWAPGVERLPIGPIRWEEGEQGEMVAIAVGSEEGVKRRTVVGSLNKNWRESKYPPGGDTAAAETSTTVQEPVAQGQVSA